MTETLEVGVRSLVRVSAALGSRNEDHVREALSAVVEHAPRIEVEEVLVQSYLFLGFPAALNALATWRRLTGLNAPDRDDEGDLASWQRRGEAACRSIYGDRYLELRRNISDLHPEMDQWMVTEGYGKVLARPGLPLATRELCIAGLLAVLDVPVQLYSHVRGCLRLGWSPEIVTEALGLAGEFASPEATQRTRDVLARLVTRQG